MSKVCNEDHGFLAPNGKIYNGRSILPVDDKNLAERIVAGLQGLDMCSHIVDTTVVTERLSRQSSEFKVLADALEESGITEEFSCRYKVIAYLHFEDRAKFDKALLETTGIDFVAVSLPFPEGV